MALFSPDAAEPGRPLWWEGLTWPELEPAPPPPRCDLLVIGAGYTGLAAAIAAADHGAEVTVIDAGQPGEGASGRNGGMIGAHPRLPYATLAARHGPEVAGALYAEARAALQGLRDLVASEGIDCELATTGRLQLAHTAAHAAGQRALAAELAARGGDPCRCLTREELAAEIATPLYAGGLLFEDHGAIQPARLLLGLLGAALRRGVRVVPYCPALRLARAGARAGARHRVRTTGGEIDAGAVVLATNGYTGFPFPWHGRRVFPVPSYIIATEPLPPERLARLVPGRRMFVETRARHSYFRLSPDGTRLVFGGRAAVTEIGLRRAARRLRATLAGIFPELAGVRLSHVWTGNTGFAFDRMPHVGTHEGVHHAMGYSGGGTVLAPWLGRKAALAALGAPGSETAFAATGLRARWFYRGGRPLFLRPVDAWLRLVVDPAQERAARRDR